MNSEDLKYQQPVKYITAMGSSAHTYGNVLAIMQKWVLDVFPKKLFKTIHVSSRIAHKQILSSNAAETQRFIKKSKPMIAFRPRIEYGEDNFLDGTLITSRMGGPRTSGTPGVVDLQPFFIDPDNGINLQYNLARRTMYFDIILIFDTMIQQINYMDYILQEIPIKRPFDVNTYLESYLSKELMEMVAKISSIPIHDASGSVHDFLKYMNTHSVYPVTYKLAGSTGKEEFYRYYPATILTEITDIDKDQGESVSQIMTNYKINLTMKMSFWTTGTNYLFSDQIHEIERPTIPSDSTLIPIFTDVFMQEDLHLPPGWNVYAHSSYRLDKPNDEVDISSLFAQSMIDVLQYHIKNAIPILTFLDIKIRKQGELLEDTEYDIDYENLVVKFHNKNFGFFTYTIIISVDTSYVNQTIKDVFRLE